MGFKGTKPEVSIRLSTRRAVEGSEEENETDCRDTSGKSCHLTRPARCVVELPSKREYRTDAQKCGSWVRMGKILLVIKIIRVAESL